MFKRKGGGVKGILNNVKKKLHFSLVMASLGASRLPTTFGNIHNQQNIGCPVYRWALAEKTTFAPHRSHCSADIIE